MTCNLPMDGWMEIKVTEWLQSKCKFQLSTSIILVRVNECNQNARSNKLIKRVKATWLTPSQFRSYKEMKMK